MNVIDMQDRARAIHTLRAQEQAEMKENAKLAHEIAYGVGQAAPGALLFAYTVIYGFLGWSAYLAFELVRMWFA